MRAGQSNPVTITLKKHQWEHVAELKKFERYCEWRDTGTGKTIAVLQFLKETEAYPALILAPLSIVNPAWKDDAEKLGGIPMKTWPGTASMKARGGAIQSHEGLFVTNYECFRGKQKEWGAIPWKTVILDESTRVKGHKTATTKAVHRLTRDEGIQYVSPMSGCPTPQSLMDFWGQIETARPGHLGGSFYSFRTKYFYQPHPQSAQWLWVPKDKDELLGLISEVSRFVSKEECLDLPETTHEIREVQLKGPERRAYSEFMRNYVIQVEGGLLVGSTALSEMMRYRQMVAGMVKNDHGDWVEFGDTKLKEVEQLVQDIGKSVTGELKPIIIVGQFRREIERMKVRLESPDNKRRCSIIYGGMTEAQRHENITWFLSGATDVMIVHPASAGHGLTFTNCSDMIFSSISTNYEHQYQVMQRIHRIGQHHPCTYYHILAADTIDGKMWRNLNTKQEMSTYISDALRWKE